MPFYASTPFPVQFSNPDTGALASGYTLTAYLKGTSTETPMYTNETGTSAGTSITFNSAGYPEVSGSIITVFLDTAIDYKFIMRDEDSNTEWTVDGVSTAGLSSLGASSEYDSVATMKTQGLSAGSTVETASYYNTWLDGSAKAKGGAKYQIVTAAQFTALTGRGTPDGLVDHALTNGNVARFTYEDYGQINVFQGGAVGDGVTDDRDSIQACINAIQGIGATVFFPKATYAIEDELSAFKSGIYLKGEKPCNLDSAIIKFTAAADDSKAIIRAPIAGDGLAVHDLFLDANDAAGFCLYQTGEANPAGLTRPGDFEALTFRGYRVKGWVIGDHTDVLNDSQFQNINARNLTFLGGANGLDADGIHLNAQNCEWLNIDGIYFDPTSSGRHHRNHIRQITGGLNIRSMLSTRAGTITFINGYAIHSGAQLILSGWRTEDRLLIDFVNSDTGDTSHIDGIQQRPDNPAETTSSTTVINQQRINASVSFSNILINGQLTLGATDSKGGNILGFLPSRVGAGISYSGPRNQFGLHQVVSTGEINQIGSNPEWNMLQPDGTSRFALRDGNVHLRRTNLTVSANQTAWDLGNGTFYRASSATPYSIFGILAESNAIEDGRVLYITNTGANNLTFVHQSVSAGDTSYRILSTTGADIVLAQNEVIQMIYDRTTIRWRAWKV